MVEVYETLTILILLASCLWVIRNAFLDSTVSDRLARNLCMKCGYDLRAGGERCPECGTECFLPLDPGKLRKDAPDRRVMIEKNVPEELLSSMVHQTFDLDEARLASLQLVLRGIPAKRLRAPFPGDRLLVVHSVWVRETDKVAAQQMLKLFKPDMC